MDMIFFFSCGFVTKCAVKQVLLLIQFGFKLMKALFFLFLSPNDLIDL